LKIQPPITNPLPSAQLAIEAILQATKAVMEIYNKDFSHSYKDDKEPITEADITSNKIIENTLSQSGYPILTEESFDDAKKRLNQTKIWIVDPLDGTTDFVNKTGEFTIMIALVEDHYPVLGIISHPAQNILYFAQKGHGAHRFTVDDGWQRIHVSDISVLKNFKVVGSRFHQSEKEKRFLQKLGISKFTSRGSSLKALDVSSGKADLYFTTTNKIKQWDSCASYSLIVEAGGKMTDMFGNKLEYNTPTINHENGLLLTNGLIHDKIVNEYEKFIKSK